MALLILLICLGLQRYTPLQGYHYLCYWLTQYYQWLINQLSAVIYPYPVLGVLVLLLPVFIVLSLIEVLSFHLLGQTAEWTFSFILLWFCMDARDLGTRPTSMQDPETLLLIVYQRLFAIMFWFVVSWYLGIMPALIIYPMLIILGEFLEGKLSELGADRLLVTSKQFLGILDWIPVRLTGLSFALVGHFAPVFASWRQQLKFQFYLNSQLVKVWGMAALGDSRNLSLEETQDRFTSVISLIDRALMVWLIAIALFTLGRILTLIGH